MASPSPTSAPAPVTLPASAVYSEIGVSKAYSTIIGQDGQYYINYTIDDTSPLLVYSGDWSTDLGASSSEGLFNNTDHYTNDFGASVSLSFYGTAIYYYGNGGANHGPATVVLDGRIVAQPSSYFTDDRAPFLLWAQAGLPISTEHQVVIYNGNAQMPNTIQLDAFVITTNPRLSQPGPDSSVSSISFPVPGLPDMNFDFHKPLSPGAIAGVVIAAVAAGAILASLVWLFCRRRRRRRKRAAMFPIEKEKTREADEECIGRSYSSMGEQIGANSFTPQVRFSTARLQSDQQAENARVTALRSGQDESATWSPTSSAGVGRSTLARSPTAAAAVTPFRLPQTPAPTLARSGSADAKVRVLDATTTEDGAASNWVTLPGSRPRLEKLDMPTAVNRPPSPTLNSSTGSSPIAGGSRPPRRRANSLPVPGSAHSPVTSPPSAIISANDPPPAYM